MMGKIIKSRIPFSDKFIPPSLVCRDPEIITLKRFLSPLESNEPTVSSMFITGNVGVGKTVVTQYVLLNIPSKINYCYIRLREGDTTHSIISEIAKSFFPDMWTSRRNTSEVIKIFIRQMEGKAGLVVLDEIDNVKIEALKPILHSFSRETWISFILLSRIPKALNELPEDTKSSLKCRTLFFNSYKKEELIEILKQRASIALHENTIDIETIGKIAEYASHFGNARLALDILKEAAEIAEYLGSEKILSDHVEEAIYEIEKHSVIKAITDLPQTHKLAIQAVYKMTTLQPAEFKSTFRLWRKYLNDMRLPAYSRWKFYDVISDLKKLGFLETERIGKGRGRGFTYRIHLDDLLKDVIKELKQNGKSTLI